MSAEKVVDLQFVDPQIVQIRMQDRVSKNTFSEALTEGLMNAFAEVERLPDCKVVVLAGYDNYFASGGTQEQLSLRAPMIEFAKAENMGELATLLHARL